jgi:hypothetical protein
VPLQGYRQASQLFLVQIDGLVFLPGYFIPQSRSLLFNEAIIFSGDISQPQQRLVDARVILPEQGQQVQAKTISEEGRQ